LIAVFREVTVYPVAGKRCKGERSYKLLRGCRKDDAHLSAPAHQLPGQNSGFVGGDAASDAQQNPAAVQYGTARHRNSVGCLGPL